jgi:hypothetical protein
MRPAPIYIVASPNQKVGKTLIARVLLEFVHAAGRRVRGYDVQTRKPSFAERFPDRVEIADISGTCGQMRVFDRLLIDPKTTWIIDLGTQSFDIFFSVMEQIDFLSEARHNFIEPVVLFVADSDPVTAWTYYELQRRLKSAVLVPVHNCDVSLTIKSRDFRASGLEFAPVTIARLSQLIRSVIDRRNFSFAPYVMEPHGSSEIHQWIGPIIRRFRELELQLFANRIGSILRANASSDYLSVF